MNILGVITAAVIVIALTIAAASTGYWPRSSCHGVPPYGQHDYDCTFRIER